MRFIYYITLILIFQSCINSENKSESNKNIPKEELKFSKGFVLEEYEGYKLLKIRNPWQGAEGVEYKYALVQNKNNISKDLKVDGIIKTPVTKVVCLSTTHIAFIDLLNETSSIVGVSGANYVNNEKLREKIDMNQLPDVGYDNSLNYELITSLNPDLIITYGVGGQVASYNQKLNDLGLQTIIIAEYLEDNPLGKLEWIKLFAALYEKEKIAEEYFNSAVHDYNSLLDLTKNVDQKPKVLLGLPWKDVWYVPGGKSFLAKMIDDAGGDYLWNENDSRESLPFSIESVFVHASNADIWLNTGVVNKKSDILKTDERFKNFGPYQNGKIFNNNLRMNPSGGNDYWEKGLIEPHIVLKDMIKIFHPDILPDHQLVYYKTIE